MTPLFEAWGILVIGLAAAFGLFWTFLEWTAPKGPETQEEIVRTTDLTGVSWTAMEPFRPLSVRSTDQPPPVLIAQRTLSPEEVARSFGVPEIPFALPREPSKSKSEDMT